MAQPRLSRLFLALAAAVALVALAPAAAPAGGGPAGEAGSARAGKAPSPWEEIAPGLELGRFQARRPSSHGDARILILRADPGRWELDLLSISQTGDHAGKTAREWSGQHGLAAATNAGMYATDYRTHVGYMRHGDHVNSSRVHRKYHSAAVFGPREEGLPPFRIHDLDTGEVTLEGLRERYHSVVQNLRLIKRPGENRWPRQEKRWSEAALGEDEAGRILFILCRSPYSMHDLNEELLGLDLGLVAAQHLEGGPEAQLYVSVGGFELEAFGSYETSFTESDDNMAAWRVPNVFGLRPRRAPAPAAEATEESP